MWSIMKLQVRRCIKDPQKWMSRTHTGEQTAAIALPLHICTCLLLFPSVVNCQKWGLLHWVQEQPPDVKLIVPTCRLFCSPQVTKMKTLQVISLTLLSVLAASAQVLRFGKCPKPAVQANFDPTRVNTKLFFFSSFHCYEEVNVQWQKWVKSCVSSAVHW